MDRLIDAAAVLLFAGATAFIGVHSRGYLHLTPDEDPMPAVTATEPYGARVARVLPSLERHVAAGSMRERALVCDERERLAEIDALENELGDGRQAPEIAGALKTGIRALRECVACTPEPNGCADAARAFIEVEERLTLDRPASGI